MMPKVLESLLVPIRSLIIKSRPAYKDYLGEETVEEKKVLFSGRFGDDGEITESLVVGETYFVTIDGVEQEMVAQDMSVFNENYVSVGFSNCDLRKTISCDINDLGEVFFRSTSFYEGKEISIYQGETPIASATMSIFEGSTVCVGYGTLYDESFDNFLEDETYTFVVDGESPIRIVSGDAYGFEGFYSENISNLEWMIVARVSIFFSYISDDSSARFSVAKKVVTTKKKYDIKLLPEELLPDTVTKQKEFKAYQEKVEDTLEKAIIAEVNNNVTWYYLKSSEETQLTRVFIGNFGDQSLEIAVGPQTNPEVQIISPVSGSTVSDIEFANKPMITGLSGIVLCSSTPKSTKRFKITVDDTGTLTTTEIT